MHDIMWDVRHAARALYTAPGFTAVAVLTLALGIGGSTAVFSLLDALLLRPLPLPEPGRLVRVHETDPGGRSFGSLGYADYADYRDRARGFAGLAAHRLTPVSLSEGGGSERAAAELVSGNYFEVLGAEAARGRALRPEDDRTPGSHPVMVISDGLWQRRFGGDPAAVGRVLRVNGHPFTVVGVMPPGFRGTVPALALDLWAPMSMQPQVMPRGAGLLSAREASFLGLIGRLEPGVEPRGAEAALNVVAAQIDREHPRGEGRARRLKVEPASGLPGMVRGPVAGLMALLMGAVSLVLLIAAANVANLLLARAAGRRREVAIRVSLGATRGRLARQLLTESVLLGLAGGAAGMLIALWLIDLLSALRPPVPVPLALDVGLDVRVLAFTLLVSVLTGLVFGLAPALQASRPDLLPALRDEGRRPAAGPARIKRVFVVSQVAVSLVLLVGAGLTLRSLRNATVLDPGFEVENSLALSIDLRLHGYAEEEGRAFWDQLSGRVRALPGVRAASLANVVPLGMATNSRPVAPEGSRQDPGGEAAIDYNVVAPGYFRALGVALVRGRDFTDADRPGAPEVAIVNQALSVRFWPGQDPVGKRLRLVEPPPGGRGAGRVPPPPADRLLEVVGVARDGKYRSLAEQPRPFLYLPLAQHYEPEMTLHVRTAEDPTLLLGAVRGVVQSLDPDLPVFDVRTLAQHMGIALLPARLAGAALGTFGALGLVMAMLGLYGVVSYSVGQRVREIGVRMAVGAGRAEVSALVVRESLRLVAVGLAIGLALALSATRILRGLLYGLSPTDPATFAGISALLVAVALLASYLPARRAARLDPMVALRHE